MDATRISIAGILEANVPLTWQEAVAVVQEVAMVSDVESAMTGSPPLVTPAACFLTTAGDVDLPETTANETPGAVADLLHAVLRGREAPAALLALAQRRPEDLFGELAAFSSRPRRPVLAELAARALSTSPVAGAAVDPARRSTPAAPTPLTQTGQRLWAPMVPSGTARPPTVVNLPAHPTVVPLPTRSAVVAPPPTATDAEPRPLRLPAVESDKGNPRASARWHDGPPAASAPPAAAAVPPPPQRAPEPAAARVVPASTPSRPRPPAQLPVVPAVGLTPQVAVTEELQRLRLKSVEADARRGPARFRPSLRTAWIASGTLAASVLAVLLWSAGSLVDTPPLLEAKSGRLPVWPFAASVVPALPGVSASDAPRSVSASPVPAALSMASEPGDAAPGDDFSSRLAPNPEAPGPAPATRRSDTGAEAAPPSVPTAPGAALPALRERPTVEPLSAPAGPTAERRTQAVETGRGGARPREIFSAGDADVAPPDLRRQQLPTTVLEPGALVPEGWPYLTLVIDETGSVESVRLTARAPAPGQTLYRHRMLVAAAKAWQFAPATKEGQPVRYAIRVPLEP